MKYSLRSLMIVALVGPPFLAGTFYVVNCNFASWGVLLFVIVLISFLMTTAGPP